MQAKPSLTCLPSFGRPSAFTANFTYLNLESYAHVIVDNLEWYPRVSSSDQIRLKLIRGNAKPPYTSWLWQHHILIINLIFAGFFIGFEPLFYQIQYWVKPGLKAGEEVLLPAGLKWVGVATVGVRAAVVAVLWFVFAFWLY